MEKERILSSIWDNMLPPWVFITANPKIIPHSAVGGIMAPLKAIRKRKAVAAIICPDRNGSTG